MPHVEQRLLVHRLVLEDGVGRLGAIEQRMSGPIEILVPQRRDDAPVGLVRELADLGARRPAVAIVGSPRGSG